MCVCMHVTYIYRYNRDLVTAYRNGVFLGAKGKILAMASQYKRQCSHFKNVRVCLCKLGGDGFLFAIYVIVFITLIAAFRGRHGRKRELKDLGIYRQRLLVLPPFPFLHPGIGRNYIEEAFVSPHTKDAVCLTVFIASDHQPIPRNPVFLIPCLVSFTPPHTFPRLS